VVVFALSGCPSVHYQGIQADFNRGDYQKVDAQLSEAAINALDPQLQFNAYTLKAFSEWQLGKLAEARQTAATALAKPGLAAGPRDKLLLSILPMLVDEQELINKYRLLPAPKNLSLPAYKNDYENRYQQIVASLKNAYTQAPAEVPPTTVAYVHCQRGRALFNWWTVMNSVWDGVNHRSKETLMARKEVYDRAQQSLQGNDIQAEINQEKKFPCPEAKEVLAAKGLQ
jgi:hypothetical protein